MVSWGIRKVVKREVLSSLSLSLFLCSVSFFVILVNGHLAFLLASCSLNSGGGGGGKFEKSTQGDMYSKMDVKSRMYISCRNRSSNSHLIFLNFFFDSGLLCDPLHVSPSIPVTKVASSPLSDGLHSNSISSSSPKLLNPSIWMTDCKGKSKRARKKSEKCVSMGTISIDKAELERRFLYRSFFILSFSPFYKIGECRF